MSGGSGVHVVFGTGPVGRATAEALLRREIRVRMVNRSGRSPLGERVDVVAGDARDADFATRAANGAEAVYQTLNPEYHEWETQFPLLQRGVLAAAQRVGARYVAMDNVYSYGDPHGEILTETSPENPHTRKGRVRKRMADELWEDHRAGRVAVTSGRASDYYGPGAGNASPIGDPVISAVRKGKRAALFDSPDTVHSYTFIPDIGEGLAELGTNDRALGRAWHLPNDPNPRSSRQMVESLARALGTTAKVTTIPVFALRAVGVINPTVRELIEMAYEFRSAFVVDSTAITQEFGLRATPIDEAWQRTLAAVTAP
ncbi:NAD-dependent epimerase/dehydratase family protein [Microbacterium sp. SLBN-154]|uniref:NAD-dependent epimerase/dehydratase family protein n=1 Tax=Microbacterium sp. SLBN-154 TaxID=2768458 RepID=UPI0013593B9A|nr:NAD-dependent epimerase/dehydratase family protein [Microbacterium sp. SLBN-154]